MREFEMLQVIAMEEADEVSQRISKAFRFGMSEVQPGPDNPNKLSNRDRIREEMWHLLTALEMIGVLDLDYIDYPAMNAKRMRVEASLVYSRNCGQITAMSPLQEVTEEERK